MKIVNPYFLHTFFEPIIGLGDDEESVRFYQKMGVLTEDQFRKIIREIIITHYNDLNEEIKQKSKLALSYYLSKNDVNFERVLNSCLLPFDAPNNARDFFVWLWEELFGHENYMITDINSFSEVPNIHEPNKS